MAVRRSPCGRADEPLALTSVPYMTIDTYGYEGATDAVVQDVENQAGVTVNAALDALGDRLASGTGGGYAWLIPDLHGNVVGQLNSSGTTVTDAFRYDAYGLTEGTVLSGSIPSPWRFQGKLLESTSGGRDLYDFVARSYSPDIGAFTSLDSVAGGLRGTARGYSARAGQRRARLTASSSLALQRQDVGDRREAVIGHRQPGRRPEPRERVVQARLGETPPRRAAS